MRKFGYDLLRPLEADLDFSSKHRGSADFLKFLRLYASFTFDYWGILEVTWNFIINQEKTELAASIEV